MPIVTSFPGDLAPVISVRLRPRLVRILKSAGALADRRGWKAYLVGGAVRDLFLGAGNIDLDILVEEQGLAFAREWARQEKGMVKLYRRFSTALVILPGGIGVDVTTTRSEKYPQPGTLPEILPGSLKEDLLRRDFTINTLAVSLNHSSFGRVIDVCGGRADLEKGIIRALHPKSFRDDPTRIFRAVRFQQRFNFKIEPRTEELIGSAVNLKMFQEVSPERIRRELELIMEEPSPARALAAMARYDELRFIHPRLGFSRRQMMAVRRLEKDHEWFQRGFPGETLSKWRMYFGALIWPLKVKELEETGRKFSLSRRILSQLAKARTAEKSLFDLFSSPGGLLPSRIFAALRGWETEIILLFLSRLTAKRARDRVRRYLLHLRKTELKITGEDLKRMGLKPGPGYKQVLRKILFSRLDGRVGSRRDQLELAARLIDKTGRD